MNRSTLPLLFSISLVVGAGYPAPFVFGEALSAAEGSGVAESVPTGEGSAVGSAPADATADPAPEPAVEPTPEVETAEPAATPSTERTVEPVEPTLFRRAAEAGGNGVREATPEGHKTLWEQISERTNSHELGVTLGTLSVGVPDKDLRWVSSDDQSIELASLGIRYRSPMGLGAELTYVGGSLNGAGAFDLAIDGFDASIRYAWDPIGIVQVYGAAGAGGRWADLTVDSSLVALTDTASTWAAHVTAGVDVRYPGRRAFVGLFMEHGYALEGDLVFENARVEGSTAQPVDLGAFSRSGYRWRVGLSAGGRW